MENADTYLMEMEVLNKAVESGQPVRIYFCNGYQDEVKIISFDSEVIVCQKPKSDKLWLVQRCNVCTIEV